METLEQKKRRLFGKQYLEIYKKELSNLVNSEISQYELLTLLETDELHLNATTENFNIKKVDFNLKSDVLRKLFKSFLENKSEKYFLLSSYYKDCGALVIKSLDDFNVNFKFEGEHTGLIVIFDFELENKILLDYYDEEQMKNIDIEVFGKDWVQKVKLILK